MTKPGPWRTGRWWPTGPGGEVGRLGRSRGLEFKSRSALTIWATWGEVSHVSEPQSQPLRGLPCAQAPSFLA